MDKMTVEQVEGIRKAHHDSALLLGEMAGVYPGDPTGDMAKEIAEHWQIIALCDLAKIALSPPPDVARFRVPNILLDV